MWDVFCSSSSFGFRRGWVLSSSGTFLWRISDPHRVDMQWRSQSCFGCGVQQSLLQVSVDVLGALADVCRGKSEQLSNNDIRWAPSVVSTLGI
jgi:hypothetical protein